MVPAKKAQLRPKIFMLKNSFIHLRGFGPKKEKSLWDLGILTWDDFERNFLSQGTLFPGAPESDLSRALAESRDALERQDCDYFAERLPKTEHYRIALANPNSTVFLDIETTGLSLHYDHTTLIGLADKNNYHLYTKGGDLGPIADILARAKCIVTFNGTMFDLKFLQKEFPQLRLPLAHVDLRFFGLRFGLRGSQKSIEQQLGFARPSAINTVRGEAAPLLWYRFTRGDMESGRRLVEYNHSDIEGMKFIFDEILGRMLSGHPLFAKYKAAPKFFRGSRSLSWASNPENASERRLYLSPFRGSVGTQITYSELVPDERSKNLRVVGIDLTGSEKRPTGWCLLTGNSAVTRVISSDQDLIDQTIAAQPDIVSIDSPLSLPHGRKRILFDQHGHVTFGIMRECELTLKRRGVNVYPCLIDSMQKLTMRGIRLTKILRSRGIPVIESYPGAAQDIMGIPRKRAGLDYLKQGLGEFGISGEFLTTKVNHDEVDAITAAVVGLFFWSGKFEALGNEAEDYLIIPDLHIDPRGWRERRVIALSGLISAGKTNGAKYLEKAGYEYGRFSAVLAKILESRGIKPSRDSLQKFGRDVHIKKGQRWLCRQLILGLAADSNLVIDGLRFREDHAFLVEAFGPALVHIHVRASEELRKERYIKANNTTAAAFYDALRHEVESDVPLLAEHAHAVHMNEASEQEFHEQLQDIIHAAVTKPELRGQAIIEQERIAKKVPCSQQNAEAGGVGLVGDSLKQGPSG